MSTLTMYQWEQNFLKQMTDSRDIGQSTNCYNCGCLLKAGAGFSFSNCGPDYCKACSKNVELCKSCGKEEYFADGYQDTYPYYCGDCQNASQEDEYEKRFIANQMRYSTDTSQRAYSMNRLIRLFYRFNDTLVGEGVDYMHINKMVRVGKYYRQLKGLQNNENIVQLIKDEGAAKNIGAVEYLNILDKETKVDAIMTYLTKWHNLQAMTGLERIKADMYNGVQGVETTYFVDYIKSIDLSICLLHDDKAVTVKVI